MSISKPLDTKLYNYVKKLADKKFQSRSGIYKSSWIVREYKKRGGKYSSDKKSRKMIGLRRWYKEKWIDLNRPIKFNNKIVGYEECGRKSEEMKTKEYPLCRPSIRITDDTPKTYKELSDKSIKIAKKEKKKVKGSKNIQFGSGEKESNKTNKNNNNKLEKVEDNKDEDSGDYTLLLVVTLFVSLFSNF